MIHVRVRFGINAQETCKRDLQMWKETYICEKRHAKETYKSACKRDLHTWKETYIHMWKFVMMHKRHAKETCTCEKKPNNVKRDMQKRSTYVKRDLHMWKFGIMHTTHRKETCTCEKKPYMWKETCKRDQHMWNETYICENSESCTGEGQVPCQHGTVLHTQIHMMHSYVRWLIHMWCDAFIAQQRATCSANVEQCCTSRYMWRVHMWCDKFICDVTHS